MSLLSTTTSDIESRVAYLEEQVEKLLSLMPKKRGPKTKIVEKSNDNVRNYSSLNIISYDDNNVNFCLVNKNDKIAPVANMTKNNFKLFVDSVINHTHDTNYVKLCNYSMLPNLANFNGQKWEITA